MHISHAIVYSMLQNSQCNKTSGREDSRRCRGKNLYFDSRFLRGYPWGVFWAQKGAQIHFLKGRGSGTLMTPKNEENLPGGPKYLASFSLYSSVTHACMPRDQFLAPEMASLFSDQGPKNLYPEVQILDSILYIECNRLFIYV